MEPIDTDALVIGAGPVGLFQVFELGLLEVRAHLVDSLPVPGGQCVELYADKPIYDIPGVPVCTGRELIDRLLKQIEPFDTPMHLGQEVSVVARRDDGRFDVRTSAGTGFVTTSVIVAGGVGSFQPRTLKIDGVDRHRGTQVFHRAEEIEAAGAKRFAGDRIVVVGDDDTALDTAIAFALNEARPPASVTLMHRRDSFKARPALVATMRAMREDGRLNFVAGQATAVEEGADGRLAALVVMGADGGETRLPLDALFVLMGVSPKLGPIADWGLALERKQVVVDTSSYETGTPGIFAVGDVNTYPGKKKLILCGFHEATLAAFGVAARVFPDKAIHLEYTTTSPRLHRVLRVAPDAQ